MGVISANLLGVVLALTSAVIWGSGDFTGGYATRRISQFQVLALSAFSGLVVLAAAALVWHESFPSLGSTLWSILAGVSGALGIASLYRALSFGNAASVAPTAAVIGAVLPVVYGISTAGVPQPFTLVGFALAFVGIWLVSDSSTQEAEEANQQFRITAPLFRAIDPSFRLALLAGLGFGGFFIFIGLVEPGKIFTPLIIARVFTLLTGLFLMNVNHLPLPPLRTNLPALLAGVFDAGGNLFYILAKQFTRLDTAAVLAAFYPASTVILASIILKQSVSTRQKLGVLFCLSAIALISA